MKVKHLFLIVLLFVTGLASAQQMGPIPVNKNVRQGKLSNGLTYYILHNEWPEHVANFYIAQRVGSIQENDKQRGLAHFLEHMAFNGSEHFPDSTLLEFTRSLGVQFGSNLNAYTSIDQTVYRICDVPTARQTALDSCLLILKDWSNGLTLADKEIDKERGVIHQEWQLRRSPVMRIYDDVLPKFYPNSKYGHRMPIGLMSIVDKFPYQDLRDYYKKWYRPDNQCIIVVGDVDVDHTENEIKKLWANATVPANAAQVVEEAVPDTKDAIYVFGKDKELPYSQVGFSMKHDAFPDAQKGDMYYYVDSYAKNIITMMLNQRLAELAQKADCPFTGAYSEDGDYMLSKPKAAFSMAADAKEYLSQLESAYVNRNKVKNAQYGDELRDHYLSNEPIPSKEDDYQIMKQLIEMPALNVDVINKYAQELITDKDSNFVAYIFAQDKAGATYPTEAQMAQTINAVRAEKIEPYVDNVKQEPLLDEKKLPKAGKIVSEKENKVLGFKELTLSNGARVILKKTNFKDNEIQFQALAKGGKGLYGKADFSNLQLFDAVIGYSGLGNFSRQELQKALSGKQASMSCGLSNYYQSVGGSCVPKDIETMMQLLYLNFTNVAKDEASYKAMMAQMELALKNKDLSPESVFSDSLSLTIFGHEARFAPMTLNTLKNVNYDRILQIWKERFANPGQFVYYFVGNFDESSLRPLIEKYIASLPKGKAETWKEVPSYVNGNVVNKFTRKSETPKAIAFEFWHAPMAYTLENEILTSAAAQVLSMVYLKSIREDASAAYSVSAGGSLRRLGNKSTAVIQAYCPMDPAKSDLALKLLAEGIKDNTVKMDADKVQKVKDFMLKDAELAAKNNGHWMDILDEYVWTGVDFQTNYKKTVEAITPAKLAAYLKQILAAGNHAEVVMTPAK